MSVQAGESRPGGPGPAALVRRWWRPALLVVAAVLVSLVLGVTAASTDAAFGPHEATYAVTTDDTVTADMGPLGTVQIDSPLPLNLGVRITVHEIPDELYQLGEATTLGSLSDDAAAYAQFFSAPETTVRSVAVGLALDAAGRSALLLAVMIGGWFAVRRLLGAQRRGELAASMRTHRRAWVGGVALAVVAGTVLTASVGPSSGASASVPVSSVFDGTPLAGARVTGRLGGLIDTYGSYVIRVVRDNQTFYAQADDALHEAWENRPPDPAARFGWVQVRLDDEDDDERADATAEATDEPTAEATDEPTAEPTAEPTDEPTATANESEPADDEDDATTVWRRARLDPDQFVTVLLVTDLHCNVGMAQLITSAAELSGTGLVLDAGDTTMSGTAVEQFCVTTFAWAVPSGVPLVTAPGNHDSTETTQFYANAGAIVLDGSPISVAGLTILGDQDPNRTVLGTKVPIEREPISEASARLAAVACDAADVDVLLVHTPAVGDASMDSGCVPAQLSGHLHKRIGPEVVGQGVRYVSDSSAGATEGKPTVGPLNRTAQMTLLRWSPQTHRFVDYRIVSVDTDAGVTVGASVPWPELPPPTTTEGSAAASGTSPSRLAE